MLRRSLLALVVVLAACSGGEVTLEIDILSFITEGGTRPAPSSTVAVPLPPTGVIVQGIEVVPPTEFRLIDVINDVTVVDTAELSYLIEGVQRRGRADASIEIRLAATQEALSTAGARLPAIDLALFPDSTTTTRGRIDLADAFVTLFSNETVWVEVLAELRVAPAQVVGDSLAGRLTLLGLDVRVVADEDFF